VIGMMLGPYRILEKLGEGGMGVVYKARDTRLDRTVAIKILPTELSADPERRARFEREAKTIAGLSHPHICMLFDVGEGAPSGPEALAPGAQSPAPGHPSPAPVHYLVMEHLSGESLAARLDKGRLPLDQALGVATEIADALAAAHKQGIIHRDLKPGNVMLTKAGAKLLDFGLAKLKSHGAEPAAGHLASMPTQCAPLTAEGTIVGTLQYMAPEQVEGKPADARTDLWALGAMLYEMLTGKRAFGGTSAASLIGNIMNAEPPAVATLEPLTPPALNRLVRKCLQKDPDARWQTAADVADELRWLAAGSGATGKGGAAVVSGRRQRAVWQLAAAVIGALGVGAASGVFLGRWASPWPPLPVQHPGPTGISDLVRFSISPPEGTSLYSGGWIVPFAVSPDGRWLAFTATTDDGRSRLWVRPMRSEAAQAIPGTEDAVAPFWSPTSEWLGFQAMNVWYRVRIPGGAPETISPFRSYTAGISWAAWGDDVILYTGLNGALFRVSVQGGQPSQLTSLDASTKEGAHRWPQFLSDGRHFLYVARSNLTRVYLDSIVGGQRTLVMEMPGQTSSIRYVPGYLFYVENMVLWAHPFDETTRHLMGERRRVVGGLPAVGSGVAPFSVSHTGVLAYWTQSLSQQAAQLQWMDRKGNRLGLVGSPAVYDGFDLSRNGSKVVSAQVGKDGIDLWVHDLAAGDEGGFPLRFNMRGTVPVWTPDGKRLVFLHSGAGTLYLADADRPADSPVRLTDPSRNQLAQSWTSSGDQLVYEDWNADSGVDLAVLQIKDKRVTRLDLNTSSNEFGGRLAPDDRWLAYVTDQTGRPEVWVAAFPSGQPRRRVSSAGGTHPEWKGDGTELYFISAEGPLVAVPFGGQGSSIDLGTQTNLFRIPRTIDIMAGSHNVYKADHDGQRFLVAVKSDVTNDPPISVIMNWPRLLAEK